MDEERKNVPVSKRGKHFTKDYQPSPEAKSEGRRRLYKVREAIAYLGEQLKSVQSINGEDIELTFESNIVYKLYEKANAGDLKAIELITKVIPDFLAPTKVANTNSKGEDVQHSPTMTDEQFKKAMEAYKAKTNENS